MAASPNICWSTNSLSDFESGIFDIIFWVDYQRSVSKKVLHWSKAIGWEGPPQANIFDFLGLAKPLNWLWLSVNNTSSTNISLSDQLIHNGKEFAPAHRIFNSHLLRNMPSPWATALATGSKVLKVQNLYLLAKIRIATWCMKWPGIPMNRYL